MPADAGIFIFNFMKIIVTQSPILLNAFLSWRLGIRSHALRALIVLGIFLMLLAFFAGAFSLRQPLVVAMDMGLSGLRFLGLMLVLFWMQETFAKDIDRRTIAGALAYPVPRSAYVLGRFIGVTALIGMTVIVWGIFLYLLNQFADWGYESSSVNTFGIGYPIVLLGILLDLIVISAFFVMISSVAQTSVLPFLLGLGFAIAARSFGVMIDYLALSNTADPEIKTILLPILEKIRWILPDLSRLDWRPICLYDHWPPAGDMIQAVSISLSYSAVMLCVAIFIYKKREFF